MNSELEATTLVDVKVYSDFLATRGDTRWRGLLARLNPVNQSVDGGDVLRITGVAVVLILCKRLYQPVSTAAIYHGALESRFQLYKSHRVVDTVHSHNRHGDGTARVGICTKSSNSFWVGAVAGHLSIERHIIGRSLVAHTLIAERVASSQAFKATS